MREGEHEVAQRNIDNTLSDQRGLHDAGASYWADGDKHDNDSKQGEGEEEDPRFIAPKLPANNEEAPIKTMGGGAYADPSQVPGASKPSKQAGSKQAGSKPSNQASHLGSDAGYEDYTAGTHSKN